MMALRSPLNTHPTYYTNGLLAAQTLKEMWQAVGFNIRLRVDERWTGSDPDMMARNWSNPMYFPDPVGSYGTMWSPTGARIQACWRSSQDAERIECRGVPLHGEQGVGDARFQRYRKPPDESGPWDTALTKNDMEGEKIPPRA
jgi:ABC-type transport system substrate-binding protein